MISLHMSNLEVLTFGFEEETLQAYECETVGSYSTPGDQLSTQSAAIAKRIMRLLKGKQEKDKKPVKSSIRVLRLSSFDLDAILIHPRPFIDFTKLTSLLLESCAGLESGLARLKSIASLPELCSLTIRTELSCDQLLSSLESFICSLSGLTDLCLLLEGGLEEVKLEELLEVHGKTLRTLVIETRIGPRRSTARTTSTQPKRHATHSYISEISSHCPNLVELGVTIDWKMFLCFGSVLDDV